MPTDTAAPTVRDPRPWWKRPATTRWLAAVYLLLGVGQVVTAVLDHDHAHWLIGALWLLGGTFWLLRPATWLRAGVLQVPSRWFRRRRIPVADIATFARPHPFDVATRPSAVLRSGERVLLTDVADDLLDAWSAATDIPVVRDLKP